MIGLFVAVTQDYDSSLDETLGTPGDMENSESKVDEINEDVNELKYDTDRETFYNIKCRYDSGLIVEVIINEVLN